MIAHRGADRSMYEMQIWAMASIVTHAIHILLVCVHTLIIGGHLTEEGLYIDEGYRLSESYDNEYLAGDSGELLRYTYYMVMIIGAHGDVYRA